MCRLAGRSDASHDLEMDEWIATAARPETDPFEIPAGELPPGAELRARRAAG